MNQPHPRTLVFDGLLTNSELEKIHELIDLPLIGLTLEEGSIRITPSEPIDRIECFGKCTLIFKDDNRNLIFLSMKSIVQLPDFPMVEHGKLAFEWNIVRPKSLADRIKEPNNPRAPKGVNINFSLNKISRIRFWGNSQEGSIAEFDPLLNVEYMKEHYNMNYLPTVKINSVEGLSVEAADGMKLVFILEEYGFQIFYKQCDPDLLIQEHYPKVNGYLKNIVLQHII